MTPCPVCHRAARGFGFSPHLARIGPGMDLWLCSRACQDIAVRNRGMVNPTEHEVAAMQAAGEQAGEYLESIAKTDLAVMSDDEFMTMIEVIVTGFTDKLRELEDARPVPQ